jgi:glyoxylase-like metal-dependent hydrolase (beta-lactamase superfamily II)
VSAARDALAAHQAAGAPQAAALDVRAFTVGPVQENTYVVRGGPTDRAALLVDPGEEPERLIEAIAALGVQIEAILITHCHFDHIGAVAPLARATAAPVYCPRIEESLLRDIMAWTPPGFGPFENWQPEHTLAGGERLTLAGIDVEVLFTPGHSPGHLTYALTPAGAAAAVAPALLSGDVLFQGSVGRTDLPGGDWNVLARSIGELLARFPAQSTIYPGHMGITTLGRELQSNPFLADLRAERATSAGAPADQPSR